jgi:pimeloyl-ACP methyl ester carboxylesterase
MKTTSKRIPTHRSLLLFLIYCCGLLLCTAGSIDARTAWPHVVPSGDGTPISYEVSGKGEPTLVFVHGWSCDGRYWRNQVPVFSKKYRVVVLDLAGHGQSGMDRTVYTMKAFGEDVRAVTEATGSRKVILIGHSMGGPVIAEAARLMPGRVIGLIGVDTLENIEYRMTPEEFQAMLAPLEKDFRTGTRQFVEKMISPRTDPRLRAWILADMSAAPPAIALSAMKEMMNQYITGEAAAIFDQVRLPVLCVNGELWPIDYAANRRHMLSYDAVIVKKADHFLMLDRPKAFNRALQNAILELIGK